MKERSSRLHRQTARGRWSKALGRLGVAVGSMERLDRNQPQQCLQLHFGGKHRKPVATRCVERDANGNLLV